MFLKTRAFAQTASYSLLLAASPMLSAQTAAEEGGSNMQLYLGIAALVVGVLYIMRRKKRKGLE